MWSCGPRSNTRTDQQQSCSNCAFYKVGKENQCGGCTLVKGPIHPLGYCNSWAAKG
ncbi:MAG: high-potential iron-sulfur protein [Deltaproteobacteria bacterium]|nr:high-potential iron-sulfur protein [Deltaproteobacteria bacterium]